MSEREDGIHHEGPAAGRVHAVAAAPERMEGLVSDSQGSEQLDQSERKKI